MLILPHQTISTVFFYLPLLHTLFSNEEQRPSFPHEPSLASAKSEQISRVKQQSHRSGGRPLILECDDISFVVLIFTKLYHSRYEEKIVSLQAFAMVLSFFEKGLLQRNKSGAYS